MAQNFDEVAQPIIDDPVRTVRVERFVVEALEQVVTLESSERDEAAEVLDVHVLYT